MIATVFWLAAPVVTFASDVTEIPIESVPKGTAGIGFGWRVGTSPYINIEDISSSKNEADSDLLPLYLYEGEYLFAHGSRAGIHLIKEDYFTLDLLGKYRFDRLDVDKDDFFEGLQEREQTVDVGLSAALIQDWGELSFTWVTDVLDRHNGYEYKATYRKPFNHGRWYFSPYLSYVYQSDNLVDYYYGVAAEDAVVGRAAYQADSGDFWRAGINTSYRALPYLYLFANISFESLSEAAENSPLTNESSLTEAMFGFTFLLGTTEESEYVRGSRVTDVEQKEWSWRINYGYTAEGVFNKIHRGDLRRNDEYPTNLGGITVGKLLNDGNKIDFWAKLSVNRRFEKDFQPDFWEYNAYVMAMGTSYSSRTGKEAFRYGFGFGWSYSEKVPWIEKVKQEQRGRETSHFLNYLEVQVDWPLSFLFGKKGSKDCYLGATLVHRSGIFANADLLGNVNGGSNVITGHLECKV